MDNDFLKTLHDERKSTGTLVSVVLSLVLHSFLFSWWFIFRPQPVVEAEPQLRYVQFMPQRQFVEAPGPKLPTPPNRDAAFSDANRRASTPEPRGAEPTRRPGDDTFYNPESAGVPVPQPPQEPRQQQRPQEAAQPAAAQESSPSATRSTIPPLRATAAAVDWRNAIREVSRESAAAGTNGAGSPSLGGDDGFAESGPISFESQWYDWGEYADAMVRKIRRNWYANMPDIIKMGVKGVVTIQFTIQRSGEISDVRILSSSTVPPFDFAARKAIELSSSLAPLPADFPNASERVTAQFYYNMKVPQRRDTGGAR